jgi:tetratricopeptide (TPR) repeat protein
MHKRILFIIVPGVILGLVFAWIVSAVSSTTTHSAASELLQPVTTASGQLSLADQNIKSAQAAINDQPDDPKGYNLLANGFMQKARETGDFSLNLRAEQSLKESFRVAPDNYDATKHQAALLLNLHKFPEALQMAKKALATNPQDFTVYDVLVDAYVELGDYDRAVESAQKRVDLRPDTAAYSRISYLRSLHGDTKGSIEMMRMAAESASPANPESIAWCRVHLGDELMKDGRLKEAEREYDFALFTLPDYHLALAAKGRARFASGDTENAIAFYKRAADRIPLPEYVTALGDLYTKLGRTEEAQQQYAQVEFIEKAGASNGTYSLQLALFWADKGMRLDEALAIAQNERAERNDIYTADTLAWIFYKSGQFQEAKVAIDSALRLGTRDPRLLYHAGMISLSLGDKAAGSKYLKEALAINPHFDILHADIAREKLKAI